MPKSNAWAEAIEPNEVAQKLIKEALPDLGGFRVECLFCLEPRKINNKVALAYITVLRGINAYMARRNDPDFIERVTGCGPDEWAPPDESFLIVVWQRAWEELKPQQREALIYHELLHANVEFDSDGQPKLGLVGHDIEEFDDVVRRYGVWLEDIADFAEAIEAGKGINAELRKDWGRHW